MLYHSRWVHTAVSLKSSTYRHVPPRALREAIVLATTTPSPAVCLRVFPTPPCFGNSNGMVSTAEQASQLVFCSAVFSETMRLWPAATMLFLHNTVRHAIEVIRNKHVKENIRESEIAMFDADEC